MKKVSLLVATSLLAAGTLVSCGSTKNAATEAEKQEKELAKVSIMNVEGSDKLVIADWADRAMGETAQPVWLKRMIKGNSSTFKEDFGIDDARIVKPSRAVGKTMAVAQAFSRAGFAYQQAAELNQKVIGRVGQGLNDVGQLEAVFLAASETKADLTGLREESTFWQKVRTTDVVTGKITEEYAFYTIYSMDKNNWEALCKKYLIDIMGGADLTTETQKKIGALFSEMKEDSDKKDAKKQAQEEALYKAQMARLAAETKNEEIKANAQVEVAKIEGRKAEAEATVKVAEANAKRAGAKAEEQKAATRALELEAMLQ